MAALSLPTRSRAFTSAVYPCGSTTPCSGGHLQLRLVGWIRRTSAAAGVASAETAGEGCWPEGRGDGRRLRPVRMSPACMQLCSSLRRWQPPRPQPGGDPKLEGDAAHYFEAGAPAEPLSGLQAAS